ncbi:MAG: alanine--glyoxylate aminotransferase family protein [Gemmatimonadetes bacterium]|nr:alanine--glyoxylate aminotransferase family protein [Gemmatimonadota bacterium]MDA1102727.1 alanine--glyoxylate aminotransferase family protein [Gemmatimonadota bacterium]
MNPRALRGAELEYGRFFLPGPTEVHPEVLHAQTRAMVSHRGEASQAFMRELQVGLKRVFVTERPVFISTSSATGLMEAAVRNAGRTRVLSLVNGAFSKRFADIARACGLAVDEVEIPWGEAHDPEAVAERLRERSYDAVTMAHSETSTGVLNDIRTLAGVVRQHDDTLVLVDSVSGFGAAEVRPDEWGIDFLLTGSQKAFALPPGLAFGVASERMMARAATAPNRGVYFDLVTFAEDHDKDQSPTTPALSVLFALEVQLERMREEGMDARWARHELMAEMTWGWVDEMNKTGVGLEIVAPPGFRSPAVTAVRAPEGMTGPEVVDRVADRGWLVGGAMES